jgi:hypothetical protein
VSKLGKGMSKRCRSIEATCRSGSLPGFYFAQSMSNCRSEATNRVEARVEAMSKRPNFDARSRSYRWASEMNSVGTEGELRICAQSPNPPTAVWTAAQLAR